MTQSFKGWYHLRKSKDKSQAMEYAADMQSYPRSLPEWNTYWMFMESDEKNISYRLDTKKSHQGEHTQLIKKNHANINKNAKIGNRLNLGLWPNTPLRIRNIP